VSALETIFHNKRHPELVSPKESFGQDLCIFLVLKIPK